MATKNRNIPLSLDDELLSEIDRVAESTKESRSAVMRRAIREGLPVMKAGGSADVVTLDSETSKEVKFACEETKVSRSKLLIEAIRTGLQATFSKLMREHWTRIQDQNPNDKEAEMMAHAYERSELMNDPMGREVKIAMRQRGAIMIRFWDILMHVPDAWRRHELVTKLEKIRFSPGGGGGPVWGSGLSTAEIEWQVTMAEKYPTRDYPKHDVEARFAARELEDRTNRDKVFDSLMNIYPRDWNP